MMLRKMSSGKDCAYRIQINEVDIDQLIRDKAPDATVRMYYPFLDIGDKEYFIGYMSKEEAVKKLGSH